MALNLWKIGGKPTSYNPLPIDWLTSALTVKPFSDYVFNFNAYSPSGATLWVVDDGGGSISQNVVLTPTKKAYSFTFTKKDNTTNLLHLNDKLSKGDIIIEDIQLIQKPLGNPKRVIKPPKKLVPKKNLFDGVLELGKFDPYGGKVTDTTRVRTANLIPVTPNKTYNVSGSRTWNTVCYYDINKNGINVSGANPFTVPSNCYYVSFYFTSTDVTTKDVQMEEGTTANPYEPYTLVNPKAKTGLSFDGVSQYLQLPSMTMDAIEIECLIDANTYIDSYILDARNGLSLGYMRPSAPTLLGWNYMKVNGIPTANGLQIPKGQRIKLLLGTNAPFTDDFTIFNFNSGGSVNDKMKGILYKVTCYLNSAIVAQYDFENTKNIVGNTVIPNAQNLIPSFEDLRWSLHANAKVMGKDVLRLDATASNQSSLLWVDVVPNTQVRLVASQNTGRIRVGYGDNPPLNTLLGSLDRISGSITFTIPSGVTKISVDLYNFSYGVGSFDFIRPQLYQFTGKEGTINGGPVQLNKPVKRTLYAKR